MTRPGDVWVNLQNQAVEFDDGARVRDLMPQSVFIDAATSRWRLRPGTGVNVGTQLQDMLDEAPLGSTIVFENGEYILDDAISMTRQMILRFAGHWVTQNAITISANNSHIELVAGCYIEKDPSGTAIEPFLFQGTTPSAWDDITVDPAAGDVTITVTTPGNFPLGAWIKIKDNQAPTPPTSGTHWETNQVRSKVGSVITLEYPLSDSYATISTVKPSVSTFTPCVNSGIIGPGKISNGSTSDPDAGNAGTRHSHCVAGYVYKAEFFQCQQEAVRYFDSFAGDISNNYIHQMSNFHTAAGGSGRGVTVSRSTHTLVTKNRINRTRHAVDISNFSRHILVEGNIIRGTGYSSLQTHPDVKWVLFKGNQIDGCYGYIDQGGAEWGTVYGTALNLRENNQFIYFIDNQIENVQASGFAMNGHLCSEILIKGNTFNRCNLALGTTVAGALLVVQGSTTYTPGQNIIIEDNEIIDSPGRGIVVGISGATVRRNTIRDITSSGTNVAIWVRPYTSSGTPAAISNIEVTDNDIEGSAGYGIMVGTSVAMTTDVTVEGNRIKDCVLSGVYAVPAEVDEVTIKNNRIRSCNTGDDQGHAGIRFGVSGQSDIASTNCIIEGNHIWDTYARGIMCVVNGAKIYKNTIYDLLGSGATNPLGIYIPEGASGQVNDKTIVEENIVWGAYDGIYTATTAGSITSLMLIRNICHSNSDSGIRIRGGCTNAILVANVCFGNTSYQIRDNESSVTTRYIMVPDVVNYRIGMGTAAPDSQLHLTDKAHVGGELELDGALNHDGTVAGFYGATPAVQSTGWSVTNDTSDKSYDANATTVDELADVLATLINHLKTIGLLGA